MVNYYVNLDIAGRDKQSDLIFMNNGITDNIYYRLYEGQYEINYDMIDNLRFIYENLKTGEVITISPTDLGIYDDAKRYRVEIPSSMKSSDREYSVRPIVTIYGLNRPLPLFLAYVRTNLDSYLENLRGMTNQINNIFGKYLDSIRRNEIGVPLGVVALDENAHIREINIPDPIMTHVDEEFTGNGMRLNKDYFIEYWDTQDKEWYMLNLLYGGKFTINRKPPEYDFDGGEF